MTTLRSPRQNHIELAQRILEIARRDGMPLGARLPEQQLARSCNVSRTPVRAALRLLAEQGVVRHAPDSGFRLIVDLQQVPVGADLPRGEEQDLATSILRDRAARRLNASVTVAALARRYAVERKTVLKSLNRLSDDGVVEKAPGQSWLFRPLPDGPDAIAESYEFRLVAEPAAILSQGFRVDERMAVQVREAMEVLASLGDRDFDRAEFQRVDVDFHLMIAKGAVNRYLSDALATHLRMRRLPGTYVGVSLFRLRQSLHEHLAILDALEGGHLESAADLMRVHLRASRSQRPQAASRGAPALTLVPGRSA
jgi:DNA-binding GntR family transcriptional regulator